MDRSGSPFANRAALRYRDLTPRAVRRGVPLMPAVPLSQVAVHLRPEDNVAVAARTAAARPGVRVRRRRADARPPRRPRPQDRRPPHRQGRSRPQVRPDHRLRQRGHPDRRARPRPQRRRRRLRARLRLLPRLPAAAAARRRAALPGHGLRPRRRPLRHPQLHRHHQHRQLLRQHQQVHLRALPPDRPAQAISQRGRRRGHHAQGRLRHAVRRPRPQPARPHPGRLRQTSQRRRLHPRRSRLRNGTGDPS